MFTFCHERQRSPAPPERTPKALEAKGVLDDTLEVPDPEGVRTGDRALRSGTARLLQKAIDALSGRWLGSPASMLAVEAWPTTLRTGSPSRARCSVVPGSGSR